MTRFYQRNDHFLSFQPFVLRVVRIDTHSRITHNCFRTGCCNYCVATFRITFYFIAKVIQFSVFFLVDYLPRQKGQSRLSGPSLPCGRPGRSILYRTDRQIPLITLSLRFSSIVKAVRSQSQDAPSLRSCFRIIPPCSSVHSQACFKNSSRDRSVFLIP